MEATEERLTVGYCVKVIPVVLLTFALAGKNMVGQYVEEFGWEVSWKAKTLLRRLRNELP